MKKLPERIQSKILKTDSCWLWQAAKINGYGVCRWLNQNTNAHRIIYALLVEPIPPGMFLDHLCRNRGCVNPAHLRIVTPRQNVLENSLGVAAANTAKTICPRGHLYDEKNTYISSKRKRHCRTCATLKMQASRT